MKTRPKSMQSWRITGEESRLSTQLQLPGYLSSPWFNSKDDREKLGSLMTGNAKFAFGSIPLLYGIPGWSQKNKKHLL